LEEAFLLTVQMKKYDTMIRINLCLFGCLMFSMMAVQAQIGVKAGGNMSMIGIFGSSEEGETEKIKPGFQGGIFYKAGISEMISVMVELNYEARGTVSEKNYTIGLPFEDSGSGDAVIADYTINQEIDSRQTYVNLPILVLMGNLKLKGYVGANIGYLISGKANMKRTIEASFDGTTLSNEEAELEVDWQDYESFMNTFSTSHSEDGDFLNSLDFGLNFGAMYYIGAGFVADLRVSQGFADSTNNHYDNSIYPSENFTFESRDDTDRNFSIQLGIGYFF